MTLIGLNNLDIIIILLYIIFILHGYSKGFIHSLLSLIVVGSSFAGAYYLSGLIKNISIPFITVTNPIFAFIILFIIFLIAGLYLKTFIMRPLENLLIISFIDKFLGTILGILKATLIVFGICYILMFFSTTTFVKDSKIFPYIEHYSSTLIKNVK